MAGCLLKGRGVDCRYFVVGVLDNLYGTHPPLPERLPSDTGFHDREKAYRVLNQLAGRWPSRILAQDESLQGADIIVVRYGGLSSPSHALIVGGDGKKIWHSASGIGVNVTSLQGIVGKIVRTFRPMETHQWLR